MTSLEAALRAYEGVVNVKDPAYGAMGDGSTDDTGALQAAIDAAFGPASEPHGINAQRNRTLYLPPGRYRTTAPLYISKLVGGRVIGAGRFATSIHNTAPASSIIVTNGCARSHFEAISLQGTGMSTIFDLNWDNLPGGNALQSNHFVDVDFGTGIVGLDIGAGGYMGSETLIQNCFFTSCTTAAVKTSNFNALQQTIIGGNIQSCGTGILVAKGSVNIVQGVGFQLSQSRDVFVQNSANDTMFVQGCRTESRNFVQAGNGVHIILQGCGQNNSAEGKFLDLNRGSAAIIGCVSERGIVALSSARASVTSSSFGRSDWIKLANSGSHVEAENVTYNGTWNSGGSAAGGPHTLDRARITDSGVALYTPN